MLQSPSSPNKSSLFARLGTVSSKASSSTKRFARAAQRSPHWASPVERQAQRSSRQASSSVDSAESAVSWAEKPPKMVKIQSYSTKCPNIGDFLKLSLK